MRKIHKLLIVLLIGVMTLTVAACGNKPGGGSSSGDDDTFGNDKKGKTIVRFYSFNDAKTNGKLKEAVEKDFYVKYPDIKIQAEISTGSFYTNLLNDFAGGIEADVFGMEPGEIYPFLSAGYLEPLDGYFEASETIKPGDIWEINKKAYAFDKTTKEFGKGKTYAVMKDWSTDTMLLYNRALFTPGQLEMIEGDEDGDGIADPLTFEEFEELATGLVKHSGQAVTQYGFLPGLAEAKVLAQFLTNAGLSWFDPVTHNSAFLNDDVKETVRYYYNILGANEVSAVGSTFLPVFSQGKCAMIMSGLYSVNYYGLNRLDLGVAYPPVKEKGMKSRPYTTGCVGFAVSSRSKVKEAAFKFMEWYLNYYGKIDAENCNNFPALKKYADDMKDPAHTTDPVMLKAVNLFHRSLQDAIIIDRNIYCSQASLENIEFTYTGEYLEGSMSFDEFAETLDYEVNKRVRQAKQAEGLM